MGLSLEERLERYNSWESRLHNYTHWNRRSSSNINLSSLSGTEYPYSLDDLSSEEKEKLKERLKENGFI